MASTTAGTKRKRDSKSSIKFYAVHTGRVPGIYHSWDECLEQVRGYPKAVYKSFPSLTDAEKFISGGSLEGSATTKVTKWYGVQSGRRPGVYTTWPAVLDQITGWKAPKHKGFTTRAEAEMFVADGQNGRSSGAADVEEVVEAPSAKKAKTKVGRKSNGIRDDPSPAPGSASTEYEPGEAPLPEDAEDGFDSSIILDKATGGARYKSGTEQTKLKPKVARPADEAAIKIYTDGSALGNGKNGAMGGVGVFFGPGDRRNLSEALPGTRQTNQRAELSAIIRALELAPRDRKLEIISDSNYAINCVTTWFQKWRSNNWVNAAGKPVENKDLVQKILDMLEERYKMNSHRTSGTEDKKGGGHWEKGRASVKFTWVKGHDKDPGNTAADQLAVAGAREARTSNVG